MKERPILLTPENAQKVHDRIKTQTRRTNGLDYINASPGDFSMPELVIQRRERSKKEPSALYARFAHKELYVFIKCPYGQVGDRLWIREKHWRVEIEGGGIGNGFLVYENEWVSGMPEPAEARPFPGDKFKAFPSIHMPRWACRTVVELTEIRVERVNQISGQDCIAEGIRKRIGVNDGVPLEGDIWAQAKADFKLLWASINGQDSWGQNPWVWCLTFKRV